MQYVHVTRGILREFCAGSGHRISVPKMQIAFSRNCSGSLRSQITSTFGFNEVLDLGMYLGVALLHQWVTFVTYAYVVDLVRERLSG